MNISKKHIIMCLIPAILTIFFIVQFTIPGVTHYFDLDKQIKKTKKDIKSLKSSVLTLRENKKLVDDLSKLNTELIGFDVEFPSDFQDEILLIDLEIFANETMNKIMKLNSSIEKAITIIDPKEITEKTNKRKNKKVSPPVQITEKSFDLNTVAYYNEIIDFVTFLEKYQRKININGITAKISDGENENLNPKIEMKISASTYISTINKIEEPEEEQENVSKKKKKKENAKNAKSKK